MFYKQKPKDISKVLCVDFDDTISFTKNREWESATANKDLIDKLNELHDAGWYIIVLTARGSISCNTRDAADKKYRKQIEKFLDKHGLIYNELSFNKPLAAYYIDDKGITPEDFINLDIVPINKGKSGAIVEKHGNEILKTHTDSKEASEWYIEADLLGLNIPKIKSLVGNTLRMDFIKHNDLLNYYTIGRQLDKISMGGSRNTRSFNTYIDRIEDHLLFGTENEYLNKDDHKKLYIGMQEIAPFMDLHKSFMHGDFSIENMIFNRDKGLVLIDPIYIKDMYSSVYLDIAKLSHSARKHNKQELLNYCSHIMTNYTDDRNKTLLNKVLHVLETTQWVRILKYHREDPRFEEYLNTTKELIHAKL